MIDTPIQGFDFSLKGQSILVPNLLNNQSDFNPFSSLLPGNRDEREQEWLNRRNANQVQAGMQEQMESYDRCKFRERNKGI